jgi:hypothetical protein
MPDLTSSPMLDFAIGMSLVFLLLSLLVSALNETVAAIFNLRAKSLEDGLRSMLGAAPNTAPAAVTTSSGGLGDAPDAGTTDATALARAGGDLVEAFYSHELIQSQQHGTRKPSYLSPRTFSLVLLDTLTGNTAVGSEDAVAAIRKSLQTLPEPLRARLLPLLDDARGNIDAVHQKLEQWFDDTMARVSGWYKRKTQVIVAIIGALVVLAMNVNTLAIGNALWQQPTLRAALVQQASAETGKIEGADSVARLERAVGNVEGVEALGVPLGWEGDNVPRLTLSSILTTLGGWLLTLAAISLGAPFWFDTLSRLSRLRSTGKPETPLPASGFGKANERVTTDAPPALVGVKDGIVIREA